MHMAFLKRVLAPVLFAALMAGSSVALADEADKLFDQGLAAYKEGKPEVALDSYRSAWKLRKTQDLATAMAQVEIVLGKHRDAAEHLSYALRYFPVSGKKELRERLEAAFAESKAKVTLVRLLVAGGAEAFALSVDGVAVDTSVTGSELFLAPGTRTIEANAKGYQPARQKVEAKEGLAIDVTLTLLPAEQPAERSMVPPGIAFGVGGAGLLVGAVTGAISLAKFGDVTKACSADRVCPDTLRAEADTGKALGHVATVGFVLAGVGAAAGVTLLFVPVTKSPARAGLVLGPGFVGMKGAF